MKILVVDDDPDMRLLLEQVLARDGFEVSRADRGAHALALLGAPQPPDLVILDVQMPEMAGWDTLAAIRRDSRVGGIPVVLCTVKGSPVDLVLGWELGCDGYVTKPFDI